MQRGDGGGKRVGFGWWCNSCPKKVLKHFRDYGIPSWTDPGNGIVRDLYIRFDKTFEEQQAGRYRSHCYGKIKELLAPSPKVAGKVLKMRVMNQILLADVGGEPYELIGLVADTVTNRVSVNPYFVNFELLGIEKAAAETAINEATDAAERAAR